MKFIVQFSMPDGPTKDGGNEVSRLLSLAAEEFKSKDGKMLCGDHQVLRDRSDNVVGYWCLATV